MRRRTRGFTLMEVMIAAALTAIVTASVLAIVRTQLMAFEMNDPIVRTQQGVRAGMDFLENTVRRACGGVNQGAVGVNVGSVAKIVPCLKVYDGATVSSTSIATGTVTSPDALEIVYATGTMTALTKTPSTNLTSTSTIEVRDASAFNTGDYVLIGDMNNANLYKILQTSPTSTPPTITFDAPTTKTPANLAVTALVPGTYVLKAATYTFFVSPAQTDSGGNLKMYSNMLMVDPDGVASSNHLDYGGKVQPAVEGLVDFQVAIGVDSTPDGNIDNSEWLGDAAGELAPWPTTLDPNTNKWNQPTLTTPPQLRQVRMGLILQTMNKYPGLATTTPLFENQTTTQSNPVGQNAPRYRSIRMVVAPRAWNLSE